MLTLRSSQLQFLARSVKGRRVRELPLVWKRGLISLALQLITETVCCIIDTLDTII